MRKMKKWNNKWINTGSIRDEGGQGRIYVVNRIGDKSKKDFVLKELKREKRSDRFKSEIKLINDLPLHKNVIKIIDYNFHPDEKAYYYVMEKADSNLEEFMIQMKFPLGIIREVFFGIIEGIKHIHKHKTIHRDLKPQNILMFNDTPVISDFGLSLSLLSDHRITNTSEAVGPRYYMAPELEDGKFDATTSADIYSLGKIFYYLLSQGNIFSREKYRLPKYDLIIKYNDNRYSTFNRIFSNSINKYFTSRYKNVELLAKDVNIAFSSFESHPLTVVDNKLSLKKIIEKPTILLQEKLDSKQVFELSIYLNKRGIIVPANVLVYFISIIDSNNGITDLAEIVKKSSVTFSSEEKIEILTKTANKENILREIFNPLYNENVISNLFYPIIEQLDLKTLDKIVKVISFRLSNNTDLIKKLIPYLPFLQVETKSLLLMEIEDSNIENNFSFYKNLFKNYNKEKDNEERYYFETILYGFLRFLPNDKIDEYIYPLISNLDDASKGCFARAIVKAAENNKILISSIDINKIEDGVLQKAIEIVREVIEKEDEI